MNIEVLKNEKNDVEIKIDNITLAEVLRTYLYNEGIDFAAWRRGHPSQPAIMKIQSSNKTVKKAIADAVAALKKDCDKLVSAVKK